MNETMNTTTTPSSAARQTKGQPSQEPKVTGNEKERTFLLPEESQSKWPDSLPHPQSECVLSVVCDSRRIHWALHDSAQADFYPFLFWKSSIPLRNGVAGRDTPQKQAPSAQEFFETFFPEKAIQVVLGCTNNEMQNSLPVDVIGASPKAVLVKKLLPYWAVQRIPILTIYVISTDHAALRDFLHLTSRLPARLIPLHGYDFFDDKNYSSDGSMGVDRLAAVAAAEHLYGGPALVIHGGGTVTTYTATSIQEDEEEESTTATNPVTGVTAATTTPATAAATPGVAPAASVATTSNDDVSSSSCTSSTGTALWNTVRVRGGGIGPGLAAKFAVLHSNTGVLPQIGYGQFQEYIERCKQQHKKHGTTNKNKENAETTAAPAAAAAGGQSHSVLDANETTDAIMGMVLHETTSHLRSVIATWATEVIESPTFQRRKQQEEAKIKNIDETTTTSTTAGDTRTFGDAGHTTNRLLYVCIAGGEGQLLMDLLSQSPGSVAPAGQGGRILPQDTILPEWPCRVKFVLHNHIIHHGISYVLMMHHQRLKSLRTATPTKSNDLRYNALGQRIVKKRVKGQHRTSFVRGTVMSIQRQPGMTLDAQRHTEDCNVYHIAYDDGQKDELNGEELYDTLVLYYTKGEKQGSRPVHDALQKMRDAKRTGAKEVAKLLEQCVPVLVARVSKHPSPLDQTATASTATVTQAQSSTNNNGKGERVHVDERATNGPQASETSKKTPATTTNNNNTALPRPTPVTTQRAPAAAASAAQSQAVDAKKGERVDADVQAISGGQPLASSKKVPASNTNNTLLLKPTPAATTGTAVATGMPGPCAAGDLCKQPGSILGNLHRCVQCGGYVHGCLCGAAQMDNDGDETGKYKCHKCIATTKTVPAAKEAPAAASTAQSRTATATTVTATKKAPVAASTAQSQAVATKKGQRVHAEKQATSVVEGSKSSKKPRTTTTNATTSVKKTPAASAAQTSVPTKKDCSKSSKRPRTTTANTTSSLKKLAASAAQSPAPTSKKAKRPRASSTQASGSVKKARTTSPASSATSSRKKSPPSAAARKAARPTGPITPPTKRSLEKQPKSYVGQRVAKYFDDGLLYFGVVVSYDKEEILWRIHYDDGDKEDYDAIDMIRFGKEYERHKHEDRE